MTHRNTPPVGFRFASQLGLAAILLATAWFAGDMLGGGAATQAQAAPPFLPFKRVDVDPKKSYELTKENGPWMVFATSFAGEGAEQQARDLVLELRQKYKLPAYVHKQNYDFTNKVKGLGVNRNGEAKQMRYLHAVRYDEIAVLVGNYTGLEDSELQKTLQKIKYAKPACLELNPEKRTTQRYATLRYFQKIITPDEEQKSKGPMSRAFATRNPMLPEEDDSVRGLDPLEIEMNRDAEFSLLKNRGKYTVKVATFTGVNTWKKDEIEKIERGQVRSRLEDAAIKANKLAKALRVRGVEAYEFHDRYESIVCVGSFESVGTPREDGRIEINPAINKVIKEYSPEQKPLAGQEVGLHPRTLAGIAFDIQPIPVEVPKVSVGASYAKTSYRE